MQLLKIHVKITKWIEIVLISTINPFKFTPWLYKVSFKRLENLYNGSLIPCDLWVRSSPITYKEKRMYKYNTHNIDRNEWETEKSWTMLNSWCHSHYKWNILGPNSSQLEYKIQHNHFEFNFFHYIFTFSSTLWAESGQNPHRNHKLICSR